MVIKTKNYAKFKDEMAEKTFACAKEGVRRVVQGVNDNKDKRRLQLAFLYSQIVTTVTDSKAYLLQHIIEEIDELLDELGSAEDQGIRFEAITPNEIGQRRSNITNIDQIVDEASDVLYLLTKILAHVGVSLDDVILWNIEKLSK